MGASASSQINEFKETVTKITATVYHECQVSGSQSQSININVAGDYEDGNIDQTQQMTISTSCFSDQNLQANLQNKIMDAIKNMSTFNGQSLWDTLNTSSSSSQTTIHERISNALSSENIQKAYTAAMQRQEQNINVGGNMRRTNFVQKQGIDLLAEGVVQQLQDSNILDDMHTTLEQGALLSENNPFTFVTDAINGVTGSISMTIIAVVVGFFGLIFGIGYLISAATSGGSPGAVPSNLRTEG